MFWKDKWVGERPLMETFHRLFRVVMNHDALISEYYNENNNIPQWSISFKRTLRDFEEELHWTLIRLLGDTILWLEDEDKWIWSIDSLGSLSVKSILKTTYDARPSPPQICNMAWYNKILPRIQIFVWAAQKKKISVRHNLKRGGVLPKEPR